MDNGGKELDQHNLDTTSVSWDTTLERDARSMGSKAITSPEEEHPVSAETISINMPENAEGLGVIEDVLPKSALDKPESADVSTSQYDSFLKTTTKLDKEGVKVVDRAIHKLNRDGDVADFYESARKMMETNLSNSYNRKLENK